MKTVFIVLAVNCALAALWFSGHLIHEHEIKMLHECGRAAHGHDYGGVSSDDLDLITLECRRQKND